MERRQEIFINEVIFDEFFEVEEVGVACEGREALVGRVAVTGGADGAHLPVGEAAGVEEVDEFS